jgi:hypothetical protein
MRAPVREIFLAFVILAIAARANSTEPKTGFGFGFCPAPPPPACVDDVKAYADGPVMKDCQEKVSRYVASVFAYRTCLLRETQRAVLETNTMLDRFKCGLRAKRRCSDDDMLQYSNVAR